MATRGKSMKRKSSDTKTQKFVIRKGKKVAVGKASTKGSKGRGKR